MTRPKVSVLMPIYNEERYVRQAVESILGQTFTNFELVLVDDGSTDSTPRILAEYARKDSRVILIENEINQGLIFALNRGLTVTRGEYIARMDADDISSPERFAMQVAYLDQHPGIGVLGTNIVYIDETGNLLNGGKPKDTVAMSPVFIDWLMLWRCPIYHPTVMIRKSILDRTGFRYNAQFPHAEDRELWSRLRRNTRITSLPDVLVRYRILPTSISHARRDEQSTTGMTITQRELKELLGETFSMDMLETLAGGDIYHDFRGATQLLLLAYRKFRERGLSSLEDKQVQRDLTGKIITIAEKAAGYSHRVALAVLGQLRCFSLWQSLSFTLMKRIIRIFLRSCFTFPNC